MFLASAGKIGHLVLLEPPVRARPLNVSRRGFRVSSLTRLTFGIEFIRQSLAVGWAGQLTVEFPVQRAHLLPFRASSLF